MKKNSMLFFAFFLLVVVNAYADQTLNGRQPREWDEATQNKPLEGIDYVADTTAFTNIVTTGHNATGNPGYVALMGTDWVGTNHTYYIWVDGSNTAGGVLMMSSFPTIKAFSSFPYGDWRGSKGPNSVNFGFQAGTKVGSQ